MTPSPRKRGGRNPQPETAPNRLPDDLRRDDAPKVPSDEIPLPDQGGGLVPAGGGLTPSDDGDNPDHPIHDDDPEDDATPGDYEWEIQRLDASVKAR